jgi:hypothetical protein
MTSHHESTDHRTLWFHALTRERVELHRTRIGRLSAPPVGEGTDERVQRWRDHARLTSDAIFALRLETAGLGAHERAGVVCHALPPL